ncbi:thioesterase family protein [Telluribacter sp. SYSU D00476]|uniref:acyl-CoA thioesterase n=1 Tax=Telluribacter sp. SYSU D00476 TaxID=2811430 RepID=UPI001FF3169C|nr:thioesterase family protein [Telluribacter sp. SYSU D00476]
MDTLSELHKGYSSVIDITVAWGEMDAAQHLNNVVYIRYMESGRVALFSEWDFMGFDSSIGPILSEVRCWYKAPVTFPDTIRVATRVAHGSIHEYGFELQHLMISHQKQRIVAEGYSGVVSYDYATLRKAPLPEWLIQKINEQPEQ